MSEKCVLVGVDDGPSGRAALLWAIGEARRRDASLHLVRVVRDVDWLFSATQADIATIEADGADDARMLAEAVYQAHLSSPTTTVVSELLTGDLFETLNAYTDTAELLVVGAEDDQTAGDSTGHWFAANAHCPVQMVGSGASC